MTPLKGSDRGLFLDFEDACMHDGISTASPLPASPPRTIRRGDRPISLASSPTSAAPCRLFMAPIDEESEEHATVERMVRKPVLKPMDLNVSLEEAVAQEPKRKRSPEPRLSFGKNVETPVESEASDVDSPVVMMQQSPRPSPTNYFYQPITSRGNHSTMQDSPGVSPSTTYRTLDGRVVLSKNPFSPMVLEPNVDAASEALKATAPCFPDAFESPNRRKSAGGIPQIPLRSRIPLPKRDSVQLAQSLHGYGSPPRYQSHQDVDTSNDMQMDTGSSHKVRRLTIDDDVTAGSAFPPQYKRSGLFVDTQSSLMFSIDETSPTEVMNFPIPPTPSKPKSTRSYRNSTSVSHTPGLNRHVTLPSHSDDGQQSQGPKSRFYGDFDILDELGKGSFGTVYKVLSKFDGCMYAVKAAKRKARGVADRDRMLKEVYALAVLCSQADTATLHIVRYHQAWMEDNRLYIQTELCTATLAEEVKKSALTDQRRYKLLREILLALQFIHNNNMVHLDIKPENIFLKNDQYKLGDFGLVSTISQHGDVEEGDSRYMSMELLSGDHSNLTKSDIFSLGVTVYEISSGRSLPCSGPEWQDLRAGKILPLPATPMEMEVIIRQMMDANPNNRPNASELLTRQQLLSDDQKALMEERNKVLQANMALALQQQRWKNFKPPPRRTLVRRNTWNGV